MPPEGQERLRQFLASRGEITDGERLALGSLRTRARERQRLWLGVPLLAVGTVGAITVARSRRTCHHEPV